MSRQGTIHARGRRHCPYVMLIGVRQTLSYKMQHQSECSRVVQLACPWKEGILQWKKMLHKVGRIFKDKVVVYVAETQKESRSGQKRVTQGKHGGGEVRRSWLVQSK